MRSRVEALKVINEKIYLANQSVKSCNQGFITHSETIKTLAINLDSHPGNPKHFTQDHLSRILAAQSQSLFPGGEVVYINSYFDLYVDYLQALRQYGFLAREMMLTISWLREILTLIDQEHSRIKEEDTHAASHGKLKAKASRLR